jgi:hypothetical protein
MSSSLRSFVFAAAILAASALHAVAQTSPNLIYGQVPTTAQWNQFFSSKQDFLGAAPCIVTGCTMQSGSLTTAASTANSAGFNVPPGIPPTSPVNGDMWSTAAGFFVQVNGATIGPLTEGTSGSFAATTPIVVGFSGGTVTYSCPTCGVIGSPLSQFAATTSAQLRGVLSDETGTGAAVFQNGALGTATATSIAVGGATLGSNALAVTGTTSLGITTGTSLALGGATIGSNALAVTGSMSITGQITSTLAIGTAPFSVVSTTNVPNLNASSLNGATFANPGAIGGGTAGAGAFSTLSASGAVSGAGFTSLFASPPAIGGTAPAAITGTAVTATTSFTATGLVTSADLATAVFANSASVIAGTSTSTLIPPSAVYSAETTTTFGATTTFDFSTFINTNVTLTGNITTMSVANVKAGQAGQIRLIQDGTGSRTTVFNSVFKFTGGVTPALSTAAAAIDVLFYSCVSSTLCYAGLNQNMK